MTATTLENPQQLHNALDNETVRSCVSAYLMMRAHAETMRDAVDEVSCKVLQDVRLYNDLEVKHNSAEKQRITDPKHVYKSQDEAERAEYYKETDILTREAGLKPDDMPVTHCPALVAESVQRDAEHLLIDAAGEPMGINAKDLIYAGLDKYHKFIDLVVGFTINHTDYEPPKL